MYQNTEAARQIVSIHNRLLRNLAPATRAVLVARQREIWNATYPGRSLEDIAKDARPN